MSFSEHVSTNRTHQEETKILEDLRKLLEPLKEEEYKELEASLLEEGCRDALVTWNGYLIDGHHRLKICKKHGLEYKTVAYEFEYGEIDAKIFMLKNQLNRRNLTAFCRARIAL